MNSSNQCGDNAFYYFKNQSLHIAGRGAMWDYIPDRLPHDQETPRFQSPWVNQCVQEIVIEPGIIRVGNGAFSHMKNLQEVSFPATLAAIGDYAFADSAVKRVVFPDGLSAIGSHTFYRCNNLSEIAFPEDVDIGRYAFAEAGITKISFGNGLGDVKDMAFWACAGLTHISLPRTRSLGMGLFACCTGLRSADLGYSNMEMLPDYAFQACESLEAVVLPPRLKELGSYSFCDTALEEIILPATLEAMHPYDFIGSERLKRIVFLGKQAPTCTPFSRFSQRDLVLVVPEDASGFDAAPWNKQRIEFY